MVYSICIIFVTSELNFVRWTTDMIYSTPILSVGVMRDSPLLNLNTKKKNSINAQRLQFVFEKNILLKKITKIE